MHKCPDLYAICVTYCSIFYSAHFVRVKTKNYRIWQKQMYYS